MSDATHECMWAASHAAAHPAYLVSCYRWFQDGRSAVGKVYVPYAEARDGLKFGTIRQLMRAQKYVATRKYVATLTIDSPDEGALF